MTEFFKLTKAKIIYLIIIAVLLIISGTLAQNVIYCITTPCPQPATTLIGQGFYNVLTFGELFVNSNFALQFKNLFQPVVSAGTIYQIFSFIISIILHYLLICIVIGLIRPSRRKKNKTK